MVRLCLVAMIALGAAPVVAQTPPSVIPIQPSVDTAQERETLDELSVCLAESRPRWARRTLSHPYLSDEQAQTAAESLRGTDRCTIEGDIEIVFRTSAMVASLAEHFLRTEIGRVDPDRLADALDTLPPRNASEDFAFCVASRNPNAARDLSFSELGSPGEMDAARRLAGNMTPCFNQGEAMTVDLQSLRALTSTALYRGVTTVLESRSLAARD
ncbi:MAG: hypothetical protein ACXWU1_13265 [Allosphingosinicella sp.]